MKALWLATGCLLLPLFGLAQSVAQADADEDPAEISQDSVTAPGDVEPFQADTNTNPPPSIAADVAAPAFALNITAPDDIKPLLERHLDLLRYRSLTDLNDDELNRLIDTARLDVKKLVATLGYFSPLIQISRDSTGSTLADRVVNISVVAGEPVQVSQVQVGFAGPIATEPEAANQRDLIEASWLLPAGNRFTQAGWSAAKQKALSQLTSKRYPTGTLSATSADVDPVAQSARLEVTLESGPAYQLGALVTTGLKRYDAELVRRLARLQPGSDFDLKELVAAQQRLSSSGFFNSAFMQIDTTGDPQAAPVMVTVREARLQKITLGLGASSDSGVRFSAEHLHQQVPGLGWRALNQISVDRETQTLSTELTAPPNEDGWRWNTSLRLQNERNGSFDMGSQRWLAGASKAGDRIDRSYYLEYDRADTPATDTAPVGVAESVSVNYAFTLRNFDTLPFASSGWALGLEVGGGTTLGREHEPFSRVLTRWQSYLPLGKRADSNSPDLRAGRLAFRAQVGAVVAQDGINLPPTQLFLAGGSNSVRGYGLRTIGITQSDGQVVAGRYLAIGSVEWQRPITVKGKLTDWEGALFIDAGSVADKATDLNAKVGVGAGVRWKTPVGPLQIDLAYGVALKKLRLHLNVGFVF
ncbi:autotransporter assembly complex protein TamA [Rhodoferax antarcticus]|uniref:Surface antigen family protein n=1 Tax=Rhodoferax antarcticus ANT.BR TaxID=1111071 RepID=A0A1Q8YKB5_9BURK|nr:BamA/TamA family outer membrane protein [Rhodoferax antarcticus]APW47377.1 outer membrane protein assembly factor [Rhodoferax antarcticus]OLP08488.1 surface antigen family protein [Rhodoferax antarcticus ANT.BR]